MAFNRQWRSIANGQLFCGATEVAGHAEVSARYWLTATDRSASRVQHLDGDFRIAIPGRASKSPPGLM
jgi:hypothetical protein